MCPSLVIKLGSSRAEFVPITMCPVSVIYLFACLVNFFLKFFHSLQFLTDSFHIIQESSLGGSAFGLWSAWRYGEFWRFGDHQQNGLIYSDATNKFMNTLVLGACVGLKAVTSPSL